MSQTLIERVLLVEDNAGDARLLREMLADEGLHGVELTHVASMEAAEKHLTAHTADIILLDLGLPDAQGMAAVRRAHAIAPHVPLVVLTGLDDESLAAQTLQQGAQDYLVKGQIVSGSGQIETRGLLRALRYAVERKSMEEALFAEKERAQVTLNSIGDAVACTDIAGNLTFLNIIAEKLTGWSWQEAAGRPMAEVFLILDAKSREPIANPMKMAVDRDRTLHLPSDSILIRRDGLEIPIEDSVAPIHDRDGRVTGAVVVFRDVSAAREAAMQITHSAEHDFLTGLPNRLLLSDRISQAIALAPRHEQRVAVLFLDLDGFKHINDSLGHPIGDKLLQSIAKRLVDCVRVSDTVSRQGGDEFVILLPEVRHPEDSASTVARILAAVAQTHSIDLHDLHVTTSIGVSIFPDDGMDAETLIKNADTAMYQAKENGRQSFQFFKPAMNVRAVERQSIEEGLRRAIERQELSLHYQPKIDLKAGTISGAEALLRWTHPTRGLVSPAQFIPVAEACGLILPIGAWVLRQACIQARAWLDAGLPAKPVAVNVSAMEFRSENFLTRLFRTLSDVDLEPRYLELELTESVLMQSADASASVLRAVRERGIRVAIDDFGTGYSSLSYLRKFPVDALKIDQSFVRQISTAGEDTALVTAVIGMARSLGLKVVAEGVQTFEELVFLRAHHCDEVQGFYFSQPLPAEQFAKLLENGMPEAARAVRYCGFANQANGKTSALSSLEATSVHDDSHAFTQ
jgi:diguanylate cyclase (GGDEF)-like protein/PAS domain S-box-containing protein